MLLYSAVLFMVLVLSNSKPVSEEVIEKLTKFNEECQKTTGLDMEAFHKALKDDTKDEKVKEHALCIGEKLGVMDSEGKIIEEEFKKHMEESMPGKSEEISKKCMKEEDNSKDTAYSLARCVTDFFTKTETD